MKANQLLTTLALTVAVASTALADIAPAYDTFSNLAGATWGGSGIPTDPAAISTFSLNGNNITLGLIAHQRYSNPALGNNGAGIYTATPGFNDGLAGKSMGPTWNFGVYVKLGRDPLSANDTYTFVLNYFNNTDNVGLSGPIVPFQKGGLFQDSWNLSMGFLTTAPAFDPNASGEYGFELLALDAAGATVAKSAIVVRVGDPVRTPDAASTSMLMGISLAGLAALRRKFIA